MLAASVGDSCAAAAATPDGRSDTSPSARGALRDRSNPHRRARRARRHPRAPRRRRTRPRGAPARDDVATQRRQDEPHDPPALPHGRRRADQGAHTTRLASAPLNGEQQARPPSRQPLNASRARLGEDDRARLLDATVGGELCAWRFVTAFACSSTLTGRACDPTGGVMRLLPTLILLHGGPGFDHSPFKVFFSRFADRCQVVYHDHRGMGRSDAGPEERWNLATWAERCRACTSARGSCGGGQRAWSRLVARRALTLRGAGAAPAGRRAAAW
jgi:hypothetical protein